TLTHSIIQTTSTTTTQGTMINPAAEAMQQQQQAANAQSIPDHIDSEMLAMNQKSQHFCQILIATAGGCVAGVFGFSGVYGFIFYVLVHLMFCSLYNLKEKNLQHYFITPKTMWYDSLSSGLMTFVLFWTFFYNIIHIY
ncbi:hypothetical protein SAMD00019534_107750, partial [Acytostelium subglobosum LB1]|uniref:hypothetical protein n=1 Tax=Acytostelium subglobosum LB1 TaxID=1410327 RepID=UPI000644A5AE